MLQTIATLPAPLRHLTLLLAAVLLSWAGTDVLPFLQDQSNILGALAAALLAAVLAVVTPLVNSYGVGKVDQAPPAAPGVNVSDGRGMSDEVTFGSGDL